ncbi:MAG: glucose-6-phosphate dehydrogenase [Planctomycetia bacterium]|nr:glucose-6-phosphate dehydrogenase [Planctomycetia bacterium]
MRTGPVETVSAEDRDNSRLGGGAVAAPGVLVILGASGDLTKRLLMPALYNLVCDGLLPEACAVIGMARRSLDTTAFREQQRQDIQRFHTRRDFDADRWAWLESRLHYTAGDFSDPEAYARLRDLVLAVGGDCGAAGNTLLYLAISPEFFQTVNGLLDGAGFTRLPGRRKIIVEKPFGKDLPSAVALNRSLLTHWREDEIYRIDHYLGKETVQNLLAFRMANGIFAPLWNAAHIDHIQISATETVGVETRGEYYDKTGVVRDMLQNHLMQMLAYVCMELPVSLHPSAVRDEKSRLLRSVRLLDPTAVARDCVRGQYGAGTKADGAVVSGYRQEPNVDPNSNTPTYAAIKLHLDNDRWAGMPVYLRSGKSLWKRGTEIVVQFRPQAGDGGEPNVLIFHIQPFQGVEIRIQAKRPGPAFDLQRAGMRFDYAETFEATRGTGYEVLLYSAFNGDPTLFSRTDFVEAGWRIVQPVLDLWNETRADDFPNYMAGTWGPLAAHALLARDDRRWHECITREVLLRSEFFSHAPAVLLNNLTLACQPRAVKAGATVVERGEQSSDLYVVCRGELEALDEDGRRLGGVKEGECFGEMALLDNRPRNATVRAVSPCDLLVLAATDFRRIVEDFPEAEAQFRRIAERRR